MSMFDNESEGVVDVMCRQIADDLFDEWNDSNCNVGIMYADFRIVEWAGSDYMKQRFNQHYQLNPGDEYYLEVTE